MKKKKIELDVDFIGGQGPLTKEEKQAISNFIKSSKLRKNKSILQKGKKHSGKKIIA